VGRCLWPGWCSGEHGGLRSLNRQFESGPGYHLVVAQPDRALPSEGRRRPFESDRRDGTVAGRRRHSSSGVVQSRTSGCYPGDRGSSPCLGAVPHGDRGSDGESARSWSWRSAVRVRSVTRRGHPVLNAAGRDGDLAGLILRSSWFDSGCCDDWAATATPVMLDGRAPASYPGSREFDSLRRLPGSGPLAGDLFD
jgi:hypothetical protein